jgi:hypothetical protein
MHILSLSGKECNYGIRVGQSSSSLTKFTVNTISIFYSKYFFMKIYSITNLMVFILYHKYLHFFYINSVKV